MALRTLPSDLPPCPEKAEDADVEVFEAAGFSDPGTAVTNWRALLERLPPESALRRLLPESWEILGHAADPDLALLKWGRWVDSIHGGDEKLTEEATRRWARSEVFRDSFLTMLGMSPALADTLVQDWRLFDPRRWLVGWDTSDAIRDRLHDSVPPENPDKNPSDAREFLRSMKQFRRIEEMRVAFLDECLRLSVDQVARQISWSADVVVQRCLDRVLHEVAEQFRVRIPETGFVILAFGKLGGLELNYSSDIDLNFLCDDDLTLEPRSGGAKLGADDAKRFFTRATERFIELLSDYRDGSPLYRVDTRLRPEGSRGRLVWPYMATLEYYDSKGRTWERLALIRMRPIAGDLALGERLRLALGAFVFRQIMSQGEIEKLQKLKSQIESLAVSRGEERSHVKIGQGGIRDVEFIVQYFQLVHGAGHPSLQEPNVFEVIDRLQKHGILSADETAGLQRGYRLLRQVEHRIQLTHRLQTHVLPSDVVELRRIARGLGFPSVEEFQTRLARCRVRIGAIYNKLFRGALSENTLEEIVGSLLDLPLEAVSERGQKFLKSYGFEDTKTALRLLRQVAGEGSATWDQTDAARAFAGIAPAVLREIFQYADPDRTLRNFADCVNTFGARSMFFRLLEESPRFMGHFLEICGHSGYVVGVLKKYPGIADEIFDALQTRKGATLEELVDEGTHLASEIMRVAGPEGEADLHPLFEFKFRHVLEAAFRDLLRLANLTTTMAQLSHVAEALLKVVVGLAIRDAEEELGLPESSGQFLVLGLGKVGGEELNYRSDVDIVFLYDGQGKTSKGHTIDEYYVRMAQNLSNLLQKPGRVGVLWESDLRLRPMGGHNPLAVSFDAWKAYFEGGKAQTWERLASLRSRPIAGDDELANRAMDFIRENMPLGPDEDCESTLAEITDMRRRLQESVARENIKRGEGGIVDVEFIVQTLQLLHGRKHPEVLNANTASGLQRLMNAGLIAPLAGAELLSAYQFLRWLETRFSLLLAAEESIGRMSEEKLRSLIQKIGYRSGAEESHEDIFLEELRYHCQRNRAHFEELVGSWDQK
jgi:glutamate-ammonia-ligase adenylyltransferase